MAHPSRFIAVDGRRLSISQLAAEAGVKYGTMLKRLDRGWYGDMLYKEPRSREYWSAADDARLIAMWTTATTAEISERLGRSRRAIKSRAFDLKLGPRTALGYTVHGLKQVTGYSRYRLRTAMRHLGIRGRKISPLLKERNVIYRRVIEPNDAQRIVDYLATVDDGRPLMRSRQGVWGEGKKPKQCLRCGLNERPHKTRGLCDRCSAAVQRAGRFSDYAPLRAVPDRSRSLLRERSGGAAVCGGASERGDAGGDSRVVRDNARED